MILGLTGSVGSGKTTVSALLAECGAQVICADAIAHETVARGSEALSEIAREFGPEVLLPDGSLNRAAMAARVFPDREQRLRLEAIVNPRVRRVVLNLLEEKRELHPLVVLDIPLLFESGYETRCDYTVSVSVPETIRRERLQRTRGMSPEQIAARLSAQLSQEEKNLRASFVVDNSGTMAHTCHQVRDLLCRLFPGSLPSPLRLPRCEDPTPKP